MWPMKAVGCAGLQVIGSTTKPAQLRCGNVDLNKQQHTFIEMPATMPSVMLLPRLAICWKKMTDRPAHGPAGWGSTRLRCPSVRNQRLQGMGPADAIMTNPTAHGSNLGSSIVKTHQKWR